MIMDKIEKVARKLAVQTSPDSGISDEDLWDLLLTDDRRAEYLTRAREILEVVDNPAEMSDVTRDTFDVILTHEKLLRNIREDARDAAAEGLDAEAFDEIFTESIIDWEAPSFHAMNPIPTYVPGLWRVWMEHIQWSLISAHFLAEAVKALQEEA